MFYGLFPVLVRNHGLSPLIFLHSNTLDSFNKALISRSKTHEVILDLSKPYSFNEWFSLGTFTLGSGKTSVTLNDKGGPKQFIVADVIKWIKRK